MVAALLMLVSLQAQDTLRDTTRLVRLTDLEVTAARRRVAASSRWPPPSSPKRADPRPAHGRANEASPWRLVFVANRWNYFLTSGSRSGAPAAGRTSGSGA
jgi:hypothetical protein